MLSYEQVETLLQELNNRKVDAFLKDDQKLVEALSGDIDALRRWLEGGMVSPCPIDLRPYGFEDSPAQVLAEETGAGQKMVEPEVVTQIAPTFIEGRDIVEEPESTLSVEPAAKEERPEPDHTLAEGRAQDDTAREERKEMILSHINHARQALEEKDLLLATRHLDDAEAIDAENTEVATLRNLIRKAEEQKWVTDLINDLNTEKDIASLYTLIQKANEMLSRGQFPELAAAKETAYRRYEDKKQLQGIATTQAAMEDYEQAKKSIRQIERDIADGQKKWNFRGQYRDIQEVASELKTQQIHNATTLANGVKAKALAYMQGETHSPHVALKTLEGAFQYVEMSSETKQDLEKTQAVLQQEALEFDRAEEELTKASGDVNPLTRLQHLRQATALYPYHPNLKSLRAEYLRGAAAAAR